VGLDLAVEEYVAAKRWARIALPGDQVSALLPGAVVTAGNLTTPIVVRKTTLRASPGSVVVEVLGEGGLVELLVALVQALTPSRIFNGVWTYQVAEGDAGRPNLRALATAPGLPAILACDKVPGVSGASMTLAAGALVLVGFRDGNPARPYIAGHLPGVLPASVVFDAQGTVSLGAGGTPLPIASKVDGNDGALLAGVNAALAAVHLPTIVLPNMSTAATKAYGV
jgi:hypothetical protein